MRLMIPLFAMLAVRPDAQGCNLPVETVAHDGRIGVAGHAVGQGVLVDEIGVGTPADGLIEPGEVIVAIDGVALEGPHAFHQLRRLARGVPGTEVEVRVQDYHDRLRDVTLAREVFGEDVPRRAEAVVPSGCRSGGSDGPLHGGDLWAGDY